MTRAAFAAALQALAKPIARAMLPGNIVPVFDPFRRVRHLDAPRLRLVSTAALTLTAASAAVALLPFRRAIAYGSVPVSAVQGRPGIAEWVWAIEAAARRLPWRTMCIEKGIAIQRLLRKSGVEAVLHYGARRHAASGKLDAHVWVTVGGSAVMGGEEASDFAEIAIFP